MKRVQNINHVPVRGIWMRFARGNQILVLRDLLAPETLDFLWAQRLHLLISGAPQLEPGSWNPILPTLQR